MPQEPEQVKSQLFILRVWEENLGDSRSEIRGQLKHILSGETEYFREWSNLLALLQQRLKDGEK
jgi:hypothetical protein